MVAIRKNQLVRRCGEHEHEWCEIPLHEEGRICAKCGEIREDVLISTSPEPVPIWAAWATHPPTSSPTY